AGAAAHEQEHAGHAALAQLLGVQGQGVLEAEDAEAGGADRDAAQEGAAADDAAAVGADVDEGLQGHGWWSLLAAAPGSPGFPRVPRTPPGALLLPPRGVPEPRQGWED